SSSKQSTGIPQEKEIQPQTSAPVVCSSLQTATVSLTSSTVQIGATPPALVTATGSSPGAPPTTTIVPIEPPIVAGTSNSLVNVQVEDEPTKDSDDNTDIDDGEDWPNRIQRKGGRSLKKVPKSNDPSPSVKDQVPTTRQTRS